jgi:hypothetical protein
MANEMERHRKRPHRRFTATVMVASLLTVLFGCDGSTGPATQLAGTFGLLEYEGSIVPVDEGPLPPRSGGVSNCHMIVADGALSLDPERRRFALHYSVRRSCDSGILSQPGETGDYRPSSRTLRFESTIGEFDGRLREDGSIAVEFFDRTLVFGGAAHLSPRAEGQYELVDLAQLPIEHAGVGSPPAESSCPLLVDHGILSLRPLSGRAMTGRFDIDYALRSSCTDEIRTKADESGSYEQVAGSLTFAGEISPNVVHPFRGHVGERAIVLFIGHDLMFRSAVAAPGQ